MSRKRKAIAEQKKRETGKFIAIMCSLVFCFAAAIPVVIYFARKKHKTFA